MAQKQNSMSFFQKSRYDQNLAMTLSPAESRHSSIIGLSESPKESTTPRVTLANAGRANTLSVFESNRRPSNCQSLAGSKISQRMSIMDIRVIHEDQVLPKHFDINLVKNNWKDLKNWELCEVKFTFKNSRHHCRKCGKWVCSKWSTQFRKLSESSSKKHRVWDHWDFQLDNQEFENTYNTIIDAKSDILGMQQVKQKDLKKKISEAENKQLKQKQLNQIQISKREGVETESDEKIENLKRELAYVTKSKKFNSKNIKNADEHLKELNNGKCQKLMKMA